MVVIRLSRVGKKNSPSYRVVVAEKQRAVKRKFIEVIGHYNPTLSPKELVIDKERAEFWMSQGAQASDTVRNLMADLGIIKKSEKINKIYGKTTKKKASKEETGPEVAGNEAAAEAKTAAEGSEPEVEAEAAATEEVEPVAEAEAGTEAAPVEENEPAAETEESKSE